MSYQSMAATDGAPSTRAKESVDVVDEGADARDAGFDEINGSRTESFSASSKRGRRGAALTLLVLAVGAVSALSAMRGQASPEGDLVLMLRITLDEISPFFGLWQAG